MKKSKTQKGITLVALIITIVVLMILAAVAISSIQNDGILSYANNAVIAYNQAQVNEQSMLNGYMNYLNNGGSTQVTIISFTIDGTTYQAEEGMTWAEWCDSSYNTAGFCISVNETFANGILYSADGLIIYDQYGIEMLPNFKIENGETCFSSLESNETYTIIRQVNGETSTDITYTYDETESNYYTFVYEGDGNLIGWEFHGLVEGSDYEIIDEGDTEIIVVFSVDLEVEIIVNAVVN